LLRNGRVYAAVYIPPGQGGRQAGQLYRQGVRGVYRAYIPQRQRALYQRGKQRKRQQGRAAGHAGKSAAGAGAQNRRYMRIYGAGRGGVCFYIPGTAEKAARGIVVAIPGNRGGG